MRRLSPGSGRFIPDCYSGISPKKGPETLHHLVFLQGLSIPCKQKKQTSKNIISTSTCASLTAPGASCAHCAARRDSAADAGGWTAGGWADGGANKGRVFASGPFSPCELEFLGLDELHAMRGLTTEGVVQEQVTIVSRCARTGRVFFRLSCFPAVYENTHQCNGNKMTKTRWGSSVKLSNQNNSSKELSVQSLFLGLAVNGPQPPDWWLSQHRSSATPSTLTSICRPPSWRTARGQRIFN